MGFDKDYSDVTIQPISDIQTVNLFVVLFSSNTRRPRQPFVFQTRGLNSYEIILAANPASTKPGKAHNNPRRRQTNSKNLRGFKYPSK